jgi:hypothetical protein
MLNYVVKYYNTELPAMNLNADFSNTLYFCSLQTSLITWIDEHVK